MDINTQVQSDNQSNPQDKSRQKNELQREIVMQESDLKKILNKKVQLEAEIRELKKEDARIRVDLQNKQAELGKLSFEIMQAENNVRSLKKKINVL